jgi:hypothetical protein
MDTRLASGDAAFWELFEVLPQELRDYIWRYVPLATKLFVTKAIYQKHHHLYTTLFSIRKETYFRNIVKHDAWFVLDELLGSNYCDIVNPKTLKIIHNGHRYCSYIEYIAELLRHYSAQKCAIVYYKYFDKNLFKNKKRPSKWSN